MNTKVYKIIIFLLLLAILVVVVAKRAEIAENIGIKVEAFFDDVCEDEPIVTPEPEITPAIEKIDIEPIDIIKNNLTLPPPSEKPEPEYPKLYTMDDAYVISKTVYGEAKNTPDLYIWDGRVISTEAQWAAIVWGMCDRYEAGYADSLTKVAGNPGQYHGYHVLHPVTDEILEVVLDVLERWNNEMHGETDVGRVIPKGYYWFVGDGIHNHFFNHYNYTRGVTTGPEWDWSLEDVYADWN